VNKYAVVHMSQVLSLPWSLDCHSMQLLIYLLSVAKQIGTARITFSEKFSQFIATKVVLR